MDNNEWTDFENGFRDLGNDIRDMVDRAVNSQDFRQLNANISRTVSDGLDNISRNIRKNLGFEGGQANGWDRNPGFGQGPYGNGQYTNGSYAGNLQGNHQYRDGLYGNGQPGGYYPGGGNAGAGYPQGNPGGGRGNFAGNYPMNRGYQNVQRTVKNVGTSLMQHPLFAKTFGIQAGGTALSAIGYTVSGLSAMVLIILAIVALVGNWVPLAPVLIMGGLFAGSSVMAWKGTTLLGRVRRFRRYVDGLKGRTYCSIKELADAVGKNEKYVRRDLRRLIGKGWFKQGHLDRQETCLIVSHETYRQYEESQMQLEERQRKELEDRRTYQKETAGLTDEVKEMIDRGNAYIEKIKESNDAIPGEEISNKISHMQMIVEKIFQRVKEHPEYVDDLRKFMDYYLPTTVKLLDAYEELDRQPVQGDNIQNGKQEIEKTLDTLNIAFEKILDSLFEDTAWDVSTDISVLKTMLAQEGLTEQGLKPEM